jgi:predicted RNA binding protein YcfA (HicA-like mRNA interferase family)
MGLAMIERNSRKIVKRLEKEGWVCARISGSHHIFKHEDGSHLITVPHPKRDLPVGTARAIAKEAGWL